MTQLNLTAHVTSPGRWPRLLVALCPGTEEVSEGRRRSSRLSHGCTRPCWCEQPAPAWSRRRGCIPGVMGRKQRVRRSACVCALTSHAKARFSPRDDASLSPPPVLPSAQESHTPVSRCQSMCDQVMTKCTWLINLKVFRTQ